MSLNIKKVQLGFRNEQLGNKLHEGGHDVESYFRGDDLGFGGIVTDTINSDDYLKKSIANGLDLVRIERGDIPYIDGLKLPICMNIPLAEVRLDKDLDVVSFSMVVRNNLDSLVESVYSTDNDAEVGLIEDYIIYITMDVGSRISINELPSYLGEYVTFDNFYEYKIKHNEQVDKTVSKIKDKLANFSGRMYVRVLHNTQVLCNDIYRTETEDISIEDLFKANKELNYTLGKMLELNLNNNTDTLYVSEDLVTEQFIAETDLLALDVIKLVKKGTDSIDNPTGEFLGLSVEALIESDSAKHRIWGSSTKYLPYLIKGNKGSLHSIKGIDSIKCICAVTNTMVDSIAEDYLSILIPKGKLLDMKTKYIEKLKTEDEYDDTYMDFEPFDKEDVDNFFDNYSDEISREPIFKGLDGLSTPFIGSGNFGGGLYSMGGYNPGIGGFSNMHGFGRKPIGGFGYMNGFGNPYGYDAKTLRKINKQLNKARKNKF